jgi:UPF0716 protein FxsA
MNVAKWLLLMVLALPFLELAAFFAAAATIGFGWAFVLVLAGSCIGGWILRHATGSHIARMRVALGEGRFTALQADRDGGLVLLAGILLLIPGFITDAVAVILLSVALWRTVRSGAPPPPSDGVVDLAPEQWHQVPDPTLPDQRNNDRGR